VPQAWDNLVTWLWELPGRIADWGRNLFTGAKGEIMGGHDNINDGIRSKWEGVVGWLRGLPGQFTEIGRNIIQGMWNGLSSMFDNMTGWLGSKVGQLVDSVKGKLGIASPSKVFKQLGAWTGEGFQIGLSYSMDDAQAGLIDSMDSISKVKLPTIDVGTINGSIGNRVGSTSSNSTDNSSTVFNITGTNAKDIASEIDKILGKKRRLRV
jgi:phage-related protein